MTGIMASILWLHSNTPEAFKEHDGGNDSERSEFPDICLQL